MYYVYILRNQYNDLYIGITDNPERRLSEHNTHRGASFTKARDVFKIVFLEKQPDLATARKREIQIKKWSRKKKELLITMYSIGLKTKR